MDQFNSDRDKTININFKDFDQRQGQAPTNKSEADRTPVTHQGLGIGLKDKQENNSAYEARNILNPIQKRYEDSKDSF